MKVYHGTLMSTASGHVFEMSALLVLVKLAVSTGKYGMDELSSLHRHWCVAVSSDERALIPAAFAFRTAGKGNASMIIMPL